MKSTKLISNGEGNGKVVYNSGVIKGIVVLAVSEVQGVAIKTNGKKDKLDYIKIEFNGNVVSVDVTIDVIYTSNIPDLAFEVQESVKHNVEAMSKYKVSAVNVHVDSVYFQDGVTDQQ
ncbi:MAG: Asp23/Gls24 family envelope stress response protein [Clostridiales bacterium]|nr:Asp23/Gls24 family envelope stress response protein [Clostridiales bacterium]